MNEHAARPSWDERYLSGDLPWDSGRPDAHLVELVARHDLERGRVIELGCGTGTNAIWLSQQGFDVVAVDLSPAAIAQAREKAAAWGASVDFRVADLLSDPPPDGPFDLAFDRGCFHVFDDPGNRRRIAERVASVLPVGGLWLSLIGSTDGPPRDHGPPRRSARDVADAVEADFEIVELRASHFDAELPSPARAFLCLLRKRPYPPQPSTERSR